MFDLHREELASAILAERLQLECAELAAMDFSDVGTEGEWLIIQNEALNKAEIDLVRTYAVATN